MMDHELLQWCLHKTRWWTWSKTIWPPLIATPWWWSTLPTQKWNHDQEGKKLCATTTAPPIYLHKMRPRIKGKKIMGTYQRVIATPQWWLILPTQMKPWTRGKKMMGTYHRMIIAPQWWSIMFNAYTKWKHE